MNEKIMNIGFFIFFIMIGINGFIVMTGTLVDTEGNLMTQKTGWSGITALGSDINASANTIDFDPDAGAGAEATDDSLPPFQINEKPAGLTAYDAVTAGLIGTQIYLVRFSELFPFLEPLIYAVIFFVTAIQLLVVAYLGSITLRTIFGGKI